MSGWKTYSLAAAVIVGTFILIMEGILPPDSWWKGAGVAMGGFTARTVAKKLSKNGG